MATTSVTVTSKGRSAIAGGESLKAESKQNQSSCTCASVTCGWEWAELILHPSLEKHLTSMQAGVKQGYTWMIKAVWPLISEGQRSEGETCASQPKGGFIPSRLFKKENMDSCRAFRCL